MSAMSAPVRKAAERATLELPFRIPDKEWFTLEEVAKHSGFSVRFVEKKFDSGRDLSGHMDNAGSGQRMTKKVPRAWFITWMVGTAQYDDACLDDAMIAALRHRPASSLLRIASAAQKFAGEANHRKAG